MSAKATIELFKKTFAILGLPINIVTDSGAKFLSEGCQSYFKQLGTKHTLTALKHSATNGAAENIVKTFKRKVEAIMESDNVSLQVALDRFLFGYQIIKHLMIDETPAKLLFNKELRTPLHFLQPSVENFVKYKQDVQVKNFGGKKMDNFEKGNVVLAKDFRTRYPSWSEATIMQKCL
ncbi:uncharacterized protein K02A2.6-like [Copidosoma floridanum]|uniref:uncharacterized protein K02A2.6-like n=1 Tax=Copidosoma floridanum TaxID=29053 RepID=UPI0006C9D542|nr:uncharacterized protein K02A2.6-like [Copidosoma floridanum]